MLSKVGIRYGKENGGSFARASDFYVRYWSGAVSDHHRPGIYEIGELFKAADVVSLVHILSGDAENYDCAVYKGEVVQSFKGGQRGAII